MRTTFKIALASVLVFSLAAAAPELRAQARRSTTTTSTSSSSDNRSATATRSAGTSTTRQSTSTATRNTGTASRSAATSSRSASASSRSTTASRSTAAPSGSASTQVNRNAGTSGNGQVNRNNGSTGNTGSTGTAARRSTGTTTSGSTAARQSTGATRSAGTAAAAASDETPSRRATTTSRSAGTGAAEAPAAQTQTQTRAATVTRSASSAKATSSKGLTSAPEASSSRASVTRGGTVTANKGAVSNVNYATGSDNRGSIRMDEGRNLNRIPPRERDFMTGRPGAFYGRDPHYFGYRVHTLPPRFRRMSYWGRDYYFYDNVYYLRYGDWYVITRPPFGVSVNIALRNLTFASVRFSYYHNVYRTFDIIDSNYRTILEQNREIARNNALLATQNSALALNSNRALSAYEIASALGLVQSFANINTEYFYEDGVFYVATKKNRYEVIVPPAGALVNELPDDYDTIVLNGVEYYKVDDTVYRLVLVDGIPALEVLGQMYGNMARKYNYY